jgi:predicted transcriptional regulator
MMCDENEMDELIFNLSLILEKWNSKKLNVIRTAFSLLLEKEEITTSDLFNEAGKKHTVPYLSETLTILSNKGLINKKNDIRPHKYSFSNCGKKAFDEYNKLNAKFGIYPSFFQEES